MTITEAPGSVLDALGVLRERVGAVRLPLDLPDAPNGRRTRREIATQLDDYVVPRLTEIDAPLLAVVGGSTGAGKSTLVNSLVGRRSAPAAFCGRRPGPGPRPPSRRRTMVRRDRGSFRRCADQRSGSEPGGPPSRRRTAVPEGLALLDAPDLDSVVEPTVRWPASCSLRPISGCS